MRSRVGEGNDMFNSLLATATYVVLMAAPIGVFYLIKWGVAKAGAPRLAWGIFMVLFVFYVIGLVGLVTQQA